MEFSKEDTTQIVIKYLSANYVKYLPAELNKSPMCFDTFCKLDMIEIAQNGENKFLKEVCARFPSRFIGMMNFRIVINQFRTYTLWNPLNVFCYLGYYDLFVIFTDKHPGLKINNMLLRLCYNNPNTHTCVRHLFTKHVASNMILNKSIAQKDVSLIAKSLIVGHLSDIVPDLIYLRVIKFAEVCKIYINQLVEAFIAKEKSIMEFIVLSFGSNQNEFLIKLHMLSHLIAQHDAAMCVTVIHYYLDYPELIPQYRDSNVYNYQSVIYLAVAAYEQGIFNKIDINKERLYNLLTFRGTIVCEFFVSMLALYSDNYVVAHVLGVAPHCYSVAFYTRVLRSANREQLRDIFSPRVKRNHVFMKYINAAEYFPYFVTLCAYRPKFVAELFGQLELDTTAISSISGHINPQSVQCEWIYTGRDRRFEERIGSDSFVPQYLLATLRVLVREYLQQINRYFYGYYVTSRDDYFNYMVKSTSGCNCPFWSESVELSHVIRGRVYVCKSCLYRESAVLPYMIDKYGYYDYRVDYIRPESEKDARDSLVAKWDRQVPPDVERGEVCPEGFVSGQIFGEICDHRECHGDEI